MGLRPECDRGAALPGGIAQVGPARSVQDWRVIANLVGSEWRSPEVARSLPIYNPATGEVIGQVPLSGARSGGPRGGAVTRW
jgi:hypothetical protein